MSTLMDRISLQFYEEEILDRIILEVLNRTTPKRNRAFKVKEILADFIEREMPNEYANAKVKVKELMKVTALYDIEESSSSINCIEEKIDEINEDIEDSINCAKDIPLSQTLIYEQLNLEKLNYEDNTDENLLQKLYRLEDEILKRYKDKSND